MQPADIESTQAVIADVGPERVAAIVAEPVQGTGGVNPPPPGYFEALNHIAADNDILLIADEVITGFGRTGTMFATTRYHIKPDIMTFAKGVTSGYAALGAILIAPRLWEPFFTNADSTPVFRDGTTYAGHATSAAVALANLDLLDKLDLLSRVQMLEEGTPNGARGAERARADQRGARRGPTGRHHCGRPCGRQRRCRRTDRPRLHFPRIARHTLQFSPPFTTEVADIHNFAAAVRGVLNGLC